jgi:hypothetical protein
MAAASGKQQVEVEKVPPKQRDQKRKKRSSPITINRNDIPLNDYDIAKANKGKTAKPTRQRCIIVITRTCWSRLRCWNESNSLHARM